MIPEVKELINNFEKLGYTVEEELATVFLLMLKMQKPLLLEGPPGVGKTESAHIISQYLQTDLIRLQCYEGLDVSTSIYEWNYQKQLLSIKINENSGLSANEKEEHIFGEEYLLKRPLLKAITAVDKPPVLLIDEIDRADEEFEAFLLELLSDFQITIPEMGTIKSKHRPLVILTSNRTRELSDALKRRCLYHWISYPGLEKELKIVRNKFPEINVEIATQLVTFVEKLRKLSLQKSPGIAETLDWANSMLALQTNNFDKGYIEKTLGCILKSENDIQTVKTYDIEQLLDEIKA
ncbi:MAG: MoxR family ATPase [Cyclobacteriaceae bacterium]|nr:MoxR family ATPase [Cyclobacteriaceae bacterium]